MEEFTQTSHLPIGHGPVHIIYRLAGSLPKVILNRLIAERNARIEYLVRQITTAKRPRERAELDTQLQQVDAYLSEAVEKVLHQTKSGPFFLQEPPVREIVLNSWATLHRMKSIFVIAVCVMGNHVHTIVKAPEHMESVDTGRLMNRHKTFTARKANELLDRTGQGFWDRYYFDVNIRQGKFTTALWYVVNNPVKADLVRHWKDWPGTYVHPDYLDYLITPG